MTDKVIDIRGRFAHEISEIEYILQNLENGLITEIHPNASMYGSLPHNVDKLRKELNNLLNRIQYGKDSGSEELGEALFGDKDKLK